MEINKYLNQEIFDTYDIQTDRILTDELVGIAFCAVNEFRKISKNLAVLAPNLYFAEQLRDLIIDFVGNENVIYVPSEELIESEYIAASLDIRCERISALSDLLQAEHKIVILNTASVLRYYPSPKLFDEKTIKLRVGNNREINEIKSKLLQIGYIFNYKVEKSGDFSLRGDILDVYPFGYDKPVRIEFFDTEIDSIREFEVETQESTLKLERVSIIPATELLYTDKELEHIKEKLGLSLRKDENLTFFKEIELNTINDAEEIPTHTTNYSYYKYFSYLQDERYSILDYFSCDTLIISSYEQFNAESIKLVEDEMNFISRLREKHKIIQDLQVFWKNNKSIRGCNHIIYNVVDPHSQKLNIKPPFIYNASIESSLSSIKNYLTMGYKLVLFFDNEQQYNFFKSSIILYNKCSLKDDEYKVVIQHLSNGIDFVDCKTIFLTAKEIFGINYSSTKYLSKFKHAIPIKTYEDLHEGDYVVHEKYGIALYKGVKRLTVADIENDYLELQFDGDEIFVPLEKFKFIRKYIAREGATPKLTKLGGTKWNNTKKKITEKINFLAEKLSLLYKNRELIKGYKFPEDDVFQVDFEKRFPYKLTPDQEAAVNDIKRDMESERPMDRLVCGDVGFGKTEVAFRAAFKAIDAGKQVVLLCPTTVLAKQHYQRALERFAGFGINIVCVSRFLSNKEFNKAKENIKNGKIHFIIGTHRLLNKGIEYNDLGLLIIDEEQRFGVEHKETLTISDNKIDVLTLSATPIPRTLQLSLVGMKSISLINTAPSDRNAVQTYLVEYNENMIYELISRELGRNGQVYYVKNDILKLIDIKDKIEKHIPNCKVGIVNGQMNKNDIDDIMNQFYSGDLQVLIATTIIENGIDVGRANLIILEDADKFGLAQLYQLRGRVGRSSRMAYAYLTYNPNKVMDEVAKKRLKTIQEFTELGSGFKIAQRDLLIRGAGDILGKEQAGFIDEVGIDLYIKLLNEAIDKRNGIVNNDEISYKKLFVDGYVPDDFASVDGKFEIYKWIDDAKNNEELQGICEKIRDIYGKIPTELNKIIKVRKLKILLLHEEFMDFNEDRDNFYVFLSDKFMNHEGIGTKLFMKLIKYNKDINLSSSGRNIKITIMKKDKFYIDFVYQILLEVEQIYEEFTK